MGLVCFRLKKSDGQTDDEINKMNEKLLTNINGSGKIHMVPASVRDKFIIRFCVTAQNANESDIGRNNLLLQNCWCI